SRPRRAAVTTCSQPGCGGTIQDGYCDTCGLAASAPSSPSGPSAWSGSRIELVDVTALPPGGGRFSGCRSDLTRAQPGPGSNVQRPVHVGVVRPAAGADHGVLPWALASVPAGVAGDARPGWVHEHYPPAGAFSLASEDA